MSYEFVELTPAEWQKFSSAAPHHNFLQSAEMASRYRDINREHYLIGVKSGGKIVAGALVVATRQLGKWTIYGAPGGPLLDFENRELLKFFTSNARTFLKRRGGMAFQFSPNVVARERDIDAQPVEGGADHTALYPVFKSLDCKYLGEYAQAKWVYILPVKNADSTALYKNFRKGHKLSIRYAKDRYGVTIRPLKFDELSVLHALTLEAGDYHGFQPPSVKYFEEMYRAFGKKVKFLVSEMPDPATGKKVVTAGAMFVLYGDEVVYLYSGSRREYKKYGGPHLMQWQMIEYAIQHGFERYNFYGVNPVKGDGVYAFKRGFKGQVIELLGTFLLPLNLPGKLYTLKQRKQEKRDVQ